MGAGIGVGQDGSLSWDGQAALRGAMIGAGVGMGSVAAIHAGGMAYAGIKQGIANYREGKNIFTGKLRTSFRANQRSFRNGMNNATASNGPPAASYLIKENIEVYGTIYNNIVYKTAKFMAALSVNIPNLSKPWAIYISGDRGGPVHNMGNDLKPGDPREWVNPNDFSNDFGDQFNNTGYSFSKDHPGTFYKWNKTQDSLKYRDIFGRTKTVYKYESYKLKFD